MDIFATGVALAAINEKIINYFTAPLKNKWPDANYWWVLYLALVSGSALAWFVKLNMFIPLFGADSELVGRVLSCILVGGGSSLIYNIFEQKKES